MGVPGHAGAPTVQQEVRAFTRTPERERFPRVTLLQEQRNVARHLAEIRAVVHAKPRSRR